MSFKATRNQLGNVMNPHQTRAKRVLCVCSAGLLRSPTLANVLHSKFGFNTRAVGSANDFCLIPITEALVMWSDEIVFVDSDCKVYIKEEVWEEIKECCTDTITLDIPDEHNWNDKELREECARQYKVKMEEL